MIFRTWQVVIGGTYMLIALWFAQSDLWQFRALSLFIVIFVLVGMRRTK